MKRYNILIVAILMFFCFCLTGMTCTAKKTFIYDCSLPSIYEATLEYHLTSSSYIVYEVICRKENIDDQSTSVKYISKKTYKNGNLDEEPSEWLELDASSLNPKCYRYQHINEGEEDEEEFWGSCSYKDIDLFDFNRCALYSKNVPLDENDVINENEEYIEYNCENKENPDIIRVSNNDYHICLKYVFYSPSDCYHEFTDFKFNESNKPIPRFSLERREQSN